MSHVSKIATVQDFQPIRSCLLVSPLCRIDGIPKEKKLLELKWWILKNYIPKCQELRSFNFIEFKSEDVDSNWPEILKWMRFPDLWPKFYFSDYKNSSHNLRITFWCRNNLAIFICHTIFDMYMISEFITEEWNPMKTLDLKGFSHLKQLKMVQ